MHAMIMEAKISPYLHELKHKLYLPLSKSNVDYSYYILYGPETVIVRANYNNAAIGEKSFDYFHLTYDECRDWMIPSDFNAPINYAGLSDEETLEACKVLYDFYINAEEYFKDTDIKRFMKLESKKCLDVLNSLSCPEEAF